MRALLAAFAAALLAVAPAVADEGARVHRVAIRGMQFVPATIEVAPGDEIEFVNEDIFAHTATADGKAFDSGEIKAGGKWRWRAGQAGELGYVCAYHPTMKGKVVVKERAP
jgi:plastocyanin